MKKPKIAVLYHYFHPDNVVSARHFADLCTGLVERGWDVEAWPCNRGCRDESVVFPRHEAWQGVAVKRVWRPPWRQASTSGRLLNAAWMLSSWCGRAWLRRAAAPDVILVGTDPLLSVLIAPWVRRALPRTAIAHWCHDLYPEGPVADGMFSPKAWPVCLLDAVLRRAYAACDLVADLGCCMRDRLSVYSHRSRKATLIPWALHEPCDVGQPDPATRRKLFGDAALGLLYSGNFGRAHSYSSILELAKRLRNTGVRFCFGVGGNRADELRQAIRPEDTNVTLAGFAPESALPQRLAAADIHLASLRPQWTGVVVPSKFFGSLAAGRPVIFEGSRDSAIAHWITEHQVGWVLDQSSQAAVVAALQALAGAPEKLADLQRHCQRVYRERFSRQRIIDAWDHELRQIIGR